MFANMAAALMKHEQIKTTLPKAKELRPIVEKLITLGKRGDLHAPAGTSRRPATRRDAKPSCSTTIWPTAYDGPSRRLHRVLKAGFRYGDNGADGDHRVHRPGRRRQGPGQWSGAGHDRGRGRGRSLGGRGSDDVWIWASRPALSKTWIDDRAFGVAGEGKHAGRFLHAVILAPGAAASGPSGPKSVAERRCRRRGADRPFFAPAGA